MKLTLPLRSFLLGSAFLATATSLHAIDYFWDSNSTTAGFGTTDGTWGASTFFSTDSAGTSTTTNPTTTTSDVLNIGTATLGYGDATPVITVLTTRDIGSIIIGAGNTNGITISGGTAINLGGLATITNNDAASLAIETTITGSSGLVKDGSGAMLIGGTSTFTGNISIAGGTLQMQGGGGARLGTGGIFAGNISIASGANLVFNSGNTQTLNGIISGAGSNQLAGGTTVTLTNANTYTGDSVIIGGFVNARWALNNNLAMQNSALNTGSATSGRLILGTGVTTPTFGGLKGSVNLATVVITGYNLVTSLTLNPGEGFTSSYSGVIANGAAGMTLTKSGLGTQTLSGANSYTGATNVNAGKLTIASTGTINSTSGVSIGAGEFNYNSSTALTQAVSFSGTGGTLSGSSIINQAVNVTTGNTLAIGANANTVGVMNFGSNLTVGGTYLFDLNNTTNTADLGDVAGNLTLGGILDLVQLGTYTDGDKFTLFAYDGALSGQFNSIADDTVFNDAGGDWLMNYNDTSAGLNGGVSSTNTFVTITAIPEPSAALLTSLGLLALLRRRR